MKGFEIFHVGVTVFRLHEIEKLVFLTLSLSSPNQPFHLSFMKDTFGLMA